MLKRVYTKIAALRRLKRLVPIDTLLLLYRSFIIPYFEYCNSLLIGIGKTLNKKNEDANYYGLQTVMNTGKTSNYESLLKLLGMRTLEHRRIEQSLIIFLKCFKENGPCYITNLFKPRVTPYSLRSSGLNVEQRPYNSRFLLEFEISYRRQQKMQQTFQLLSIILIQQTLVAANAVLVLNIPL